MDILNHIFFFNDLVVTMFIRSIRELDTARPGTRCTTRAMSTRPKIDDAFGAFTKLETSNAISGLTSGAGLYHYAHGDAAAPFSTPGSGPGVFSFKLEVVYVWAND